MTWVLELTTEERSEEELAALLLGLGVRAFEQRTEARRASALVYAEEQRELVAIRERVRDAAAGVRVAADLRQLDESWRTAWIEHLGPVALTATLRVVPEGHVDQRTGDLVLEAALAFGFGEHATTRLCARWVQQQCAGRPTTLLDVGCGTGVLCFVAARAGATAVGVDTWPDAIASAARNAARNGLSAHCQFVAGSVEAVPQSADGGTQFDVVVANLEAPILLGLAPALVRLLAPQGICGVSGLLREQETSVIGAFAQAGLPLTVTEREEGWTLLTGRRDG